MGELIRPGGGAYRRRNTVTEMPVVDIILS